MQTYPVSCNKDCGGGCPLLAHVEDGRIIRISNNPAGTAYMKGCQKGFQAMKMDLHPDRLTLPLIRRPGAPRTFSSVEESRRQFREASWEEALDLAARRLQEFKEERGCTALLDLSSGGACRGKIHNNTPLTSRFLTLWGGATRTLGDYSSAAASFALPYVFGTNMSGMDAGNLIHSKMIILWGYNAFDTRFGCEMPARIKEAKNRGIPVVVIDPRRTRTVDVLGTWWIPIKPGNDTALMAALLYQLIRSDRQDHLLIERCSSGFPQLKSYITGEIDGTPKNPEWASGLCGIPVETIEILADMYARIKPAALLPGLSLQRALGGEEAARMPAALQLATGNTGIPGGSSGGMIWGKMPGPYCPSIPVPPQNDPAFPVYQWPDVILEGELNSRKYPIKGAYITGSNLLAQGSDIGKNIRAFQNLELIIGHDFFLTPTMALCDIVFPVASFLERNDIVKPAGNFLLYSAKAAEPPRGVLTDYEIFSALAVRLGFGDSYTEGRSAEEWLDCFLLESEIPDPEEFKKTGIFIGGEQERNAFADFIRDPLNHPLNTPSGKIEIASEEYEKLGFPAYPHIRKNAPEDTAYPLSLITPHALQGIHSQFGNVPGFRKEEETCLWIHPKDASSRGLGPQETVCLESADGRIEVPVRITEKIIQGCVCLNEGNWPRLVEKGNRMIDTAGSPNMLTSTVPTMPSHATRTHTIFVQVSPVKMAGCTIT